MAKNEEEMRDNNFTRWHTHVGTDVVGDLVN